MATNTKEQPIREQNGEHADGRVAREHGTTEDGIDHQRGGSTVRLQVVALPIGQIGPNPFQPRTGFDAEEMDELVLSVRAHGVLQPITVRTAKTPEVVDDTSDSKGTDNGGRNNGKRNGHMAAAKSKSGHRSTNRNGSSGSGEARYHLVTGERRLRACKEAGRKTIPAIIRDDLSDAAAAELALVENIQRSNLTVIEEAAGYKRLMLHFRMKEERIARKVGKSVATIKETIKLLLLPEPVQQLLATRSLTPSHGQHLLRIAPFEPVCVQVALKAAQEHLTAASLANSLLPNARDLRDKGFLVELDHKTQFDWKSECGNCPHKAYVQSGYSSYCLLPEEWRKKNAAAREIKQQEATRVLEEAREMGRTTVEAEKLPPGSYRHLSHSPLPAGCDAACPCRGETEDPRDPTCRLPVCLDPERYRSLVETERQAHEQARQRLFTELWNEANDVLRAEQETGLSTKTALLLVRSVLLDYRYDDRDVWIALLRQAGEGLGFDLPWDQFLEAEDELLVVLQDVQPVQLLLLAASVLVAQETEHAVRYCTETPGLDLLLGRRQATQPELLDEAAGTEPAAQAIPQPPISQASDPQSGAPIDDGTPAATVMSSGSDLEGTDPHSAEPEMLGPEVPSGDDLIEEELSLAEFYASSSGEASDESESEVSWNEEAGEWEPETGEYLVAEDSPETESLDEASTAGPLGGAADTTALEPQM